MRPLPHVLAVALALLAAPFLPAQAPVDTVAARGTILPPGAGERLVYCQRPLVVTLKIDSTVAPATGLLAGIGELRGDEGPSTHRRSDELLYVLGGWGFAAIGVDTFPLAPGSIAFVPTGTPHRIVSTGKSPMRYFFLVDSTPSAAGFRRAAQAGCAGSPASSSPMAPATAPRSRPANESARAVVLAPGEGERITYCPFPLTITALLDSVTAPAARFQAAAGVLRRGTEAATHRGDDEIVLVTHGRGRAFVGADTAAVEPGSLMFTPRGVRHGLANDGASTLEYLVIFNGPGGRSGYRALAARPGPYCLGERAP